MRCGETPHLRERQVQGRGLLLLVLAVLLGSFDPIHAQKTRHIGKQARIFYDEHMIPHVLGQSDEAAFYALGYHHMVDFPIATLNALWLHSGRMAEIIAGGPEALAARPIISYSACWTVSPLRYATETVAVLDQIVACGLPVVISSAPQAGATSPGGG